MFEIKKTSEGEPPSFSFAHWFFGRSLGLVVLTAFLSYWVQADALIGPDGISPWQHDLERIESFLESNEAEQNKFTLRPTLLWYSFLFQPSSSLHSRDHLISVTNAWLYA